MANSTIAANAQTKTLEVSTAGAPDGAKVTLQQEADGSLTVTVSAGSWSGSWTATAK